MPLNLLLSYALTTENDLKTIAATIPKDTKIIIDSGAFTAFKTGREITLNEYMRFIDELPFKPYAYINLDVIGDPAASMQNYKQMLSNGYNPVPVITKGGSVDEFNEYGGAPFVALGGLVGAITSRNEKVGWIDKCVRAANEKNIKLHLLGLTSAALLMRWPIASADSSSWDSSTRFGTFTLYAGGGKLLGFQRKTVRVKLQNNPQLKMLLRQHGAQPYAMIEEKNWRGGASYVGSVSARAYIKYADDFEINTGKKLFIAAVGSRSKVVIEEYKKEQEGKYVSSNFAVGRTR